MEFGRREGGRGEWNLEGGREGGMGFGRREGGMEFGRREGGREGGGGFLDRKIQYYCSLATGSEVWNTWQGNVACEQKQLGAKRAPHWKKQNRKGTHFLPQRKSSG